MRAGDVIDGRYRIDAPLAKGGMGAVYKATHLGTDRLVALKVINRDLVSSPVMLERFRREAKAAGRLSHPHVVNVTDFGLGEVDGKPVAYLVMEYLHGRTLRDLLKERKVLDTNLAIDITEQVALAIDAAHKIGIVHRDLKPENIWLEPLGTDRFHAKVLDFGIAKLREELEVAPSQLPEQLKRLDSFDDDVIVVGEVPRAVTMAANAGPTMGGSMSGAMGASMGASMPGARPDRLTVMRGAPATADAPTMARGTSSPSAGRTDTWNVPDAGARTMTATGQVSWKSVRSSSISNPSSAFASRSSQASFLSTPASGQLTEVGGILGTPYYMAPEQFRGDAVDEKADVYALGVCVYQMLTGDVPHRGSVGQLALVHADATPPPPMKGVSRSLEHIVMRALAYDPAQRPKSARLIAAGLRGAAETEDVVRRRALAIPGSELVTTVGVTVVPYLVPATALVLAAQESTKLWYFAPVITVVLAALSALSTMATASYLRLTTADTATKRAREALRLTLARLGQAPRAMAAVLAGNPMAPAAFVIAPRANVKALSSSVRGVLRALTLRTWAAAIVVTCAIPFAALLRALALDALHASLKQGTTPSPTLAVVVAIFGVVTALGPVILGSILQLPVSLTAVEAFDNARAIAGDDVEKPAHARKVARARTLYGFVPAVVGVIAWYVVVTAGFEAAVLHDDAESAAVLVNLGADPNPTSSRQPLHDAAFAGHARTVEVLLQGGASPDAFDQLPGAGGGATPLLAAISAGSNECVRLLLQYGANPNLAAKSGETPLHSAVARKSSPQARQVIVRMLLEKGANPRTPGVDGKTPIELAQQDGDPVLAKLFAGR